MNQHISIPLSIQIAKYYPHKSIVMGVQDENTSKWSAALMKLDGDVLGETIFSFEFYSYPNQMMAMNAMNALCQEMKNNILAMSN